MAEGKYEPSAEEIAKAEAMMTPREKENETIRENAEKIRTNLENVIKELGPKTTEYLRSGSDVNGTAVMTMIAQKYAELYGDVYVTEVYSEFQSDFPGAPVTIDKSRISPNDEIAYRFWGARPTRTDAGTFDNDCVRGGGWTMLGKVEEKASDQVVKQSGEVVRQYSYAVDASLEELKRNLTLVERDIQKGSVKPKNGSWTKLSTLYHFSKKETK